MNWDNESFVNKVLWVINTKIKKYIDNKRYELISYCIVVLFSYYIS